MSTTDRQTDRQTDVKYRTTTAVYIRVSMDKVDSVPSANEMFALRRCMCTGMHIQMYAYGNVFVVDRQSSVWCSRVFVVLCGGCVMMILKWHI